LGAAELGSGGGYTDDVTGDKDGAYNPSMRPRTVFYDPVVCKETPRWLWLATGVRALDHAIETLVSPDVDPISQALATSAVQDLFDVLPRYAADPSSESVRLSCQIAAWKGYTAPSIAAAGFSHLLGRNVGAKNNIPHGVTSCVILPQVVRYYDRLPSVRPSLDRLSRALRFDPVSDGTYALADALESLIGGLGLPTRFSAAQLSDDAAHEAAKKTAEQSGLPYEVVHATLSRCRA
jgi:alcohol dehydrogenase